MKIFPNPTGGSFDIRLEETEILGVKVYDMSGTEVLPVQPASISGNQARMDLSAAPKGIYLVEISTLNGIYRDKLVYR